MTVSDAADARARLSAIIQSSDDAIIATDLEGVVVAWNPGAESLYGYIADEMIGTHISRIYVAGQIPLVDEVLRKIRRGEANNVLEGKRIRANGEFVDVEVRISPIIDEAGVVVGTSSIARAIGDRLLREQELRESREFLERTQMIGQFGSWKALIGPESIQTWTPESYRIFGLEQGTKVRNVDVYNMIHPDDRELFVETFIKVRNDRKPVEMEVRFNRSDGAQRWLFIAADAQYDESGLPIGMTGIVKDVTEHKEDEFRLAHDAFYDELTGLPNKALFFDRAILATERARRDGSKVAVLYFDIDRFKLFNDARGHDHGDDLLRAVADRLRASMRSTDTVARFTADEYGFICEDIESATDAVERATRIQEAIEAPFALVGGEERITASIGIAVSNPDVTPEMLVRDADLAMHRAKEQGRNRFELYDIELRRQVSQRFALEAALRRALEAEELYLEYQPIVSLAENRYVGAEALIRWMRPGHGVVMPDDFIHIAEETGLIVPIGTWALETACRQLREWRDISSTGDEWRISVNVAALQLSAPGFPTVIEGVLERAELDASALRIELTESVLIDDQMMTTVLRQIRQLGIHISIDDFGTKYSSLAYLKRLPIDELKIDQSFVEGVVGNESNHAIVSAILAIGRSLDLSVTAEGVETEDQLVELERLGCELVQGFYFARPLSPKECLVELQRGPRVVE